MPRAPLVLTLAGLLPFLGGASAIAWYDGEIARQAGAQLVLLVYAAVILSFLGGVRWGVEMKAHPARPALGVMAVSVLGALTGWGLVLTAVLARFSPELFLAAAGALALHGIWDVHAGRALAPWYPRLRWIASLGAVLCLVVAWLVTRL